MKVTQRADGKTVYRTIDGDMVDQIAKAYYGTHKGTTVLIYEANPRLCDQPLVLEAGLDIILPPFAAQEPPPVINLWD